MGTDPTALFAEVSTPLRVAIDAYVTAGAEPIGCTISTTQDGWRVCATGWRGIHNEIVVARYAGNALDGCGRMLLERLNGGYALAYRRGTPATDPILLLRDIEAAPEGSGAGRLLFGLLGALADSDRRWAFLDAAPRGDLDRTLRVFGAAGFVKARPGSDDCVFMRRPRDPATQSRTR